MTKGAQEGEMNKGETSSEKLRQVKYIVNGRLKENKYTSFHPC